MDLIGPSACQDYSRIPSSESFGKQGGGCANLGLTAQNSELHCYMQNIWAFVWC